jgi:hypothetical protein
MSAFKVNVVARNPKREELSTQPRADAGARQWTLAVQLV